MFTIVLEQSYTMNTNDNRKTIATSDVDNHIDEDISNALCVGWTSYVIP